MAKKGGKARSVRRRASLHDVDTTLGKILDDLKENPAHPNWPLAVRGVTALRELNEILCRLLGGSRGGDGDFGPPGTSRR